MEYNNKLADELMDFMGESVLVMCGGFYYHGEIEFIGGTFIKLKNPWVVYNTGEDGKPDYELVLRICSEKFPKGNPFKLIAISQIEGVDFGRKTPKK